jgi:copper homeostasis protein (lipoprotein)
MKIRLLKALTIVCFVLFKTAAAEATPDWPGIYYGFLPCADCKGIKTRLGLNKNGTYVFITQYVGKSEREFYEKGKYTWNPDNNTLTLMPRKDGKIHQWLVGEDVLTQLNEDGQAYIGADAIHYRLHRKDEMDASTQQHAH